MAAYAPPDHLGGEEIEPPTEASREIKVAIRDLTGTAIRNQRLSDRREGAEVTALQFLHRHDVEIDPDALMVEALRNGWGGTGPEDLRDLAVGVAEGRAFRIRHKGRLSEAVCATWLRTSGS